MPSFICVTCGNQFAATAQPPHHCPICEDDRQYVNPSGQAWTTLDELQTSHHNIVRALEPGLWEIATQPKFGIGQRALLVRGQAGNVLWDCVSLIDQATIEAVQALGGLSALAMSHPHLFGSMVDWSHAFGNAPIYLHASFREWVQRPDPTFRYWDAESHALAGGIGLQRCGGHFDGSSVLHWPDGADGRGVLLSSDTLYVTPDRRHVTFMHSYPNFIPLDVPTVERVVGAVMPLQFDRIYGHFDNLSIETDAKAAVERSLGRYKQAIGVRN